MGTKSDAASWIRLLLLFAVAVPAASFVPADKAELIAAALKDGSDIADWNVSKVTDMPVPRRASAHARHENSEANTALL